MNDERGPEAAAWERARQLRVEREQAVQDAQAERVRATTAATTEAQRQEQSSDRRALALWLVAAAGVVALVVVAILVVSNRASVRGASDTDVDVEDAGGGLAPNDPVTTDPGGRRVSPSLDADAPPVVDLTGDNFDRVWRQAQVLEGWLLRHPHAELVDQIYLPGTSTYVEVHGYIGDLQTNFRTEVVENYRIVDITVVDRPAPDRVVLRYTDAYDSRDLVDASTSAVLDHEVSDGQARAWTLVLQRAPDGRWQVQEITPADGSSPESGAPAG